MLMTKMITMMKEMVTNGDDDDDDDIVCDGENNVDSNDVDGPIWKRFLRGDLFS